MFFHAQYALTLQSLLFSLCFFCCFCFAVLLAFLCVFALFSKYFKGSAEKKILAFFRGILAFFFLFKKQDWRVRVSGRPGSRTTERNGGSSTSYLARISRVPLFCTCFFIGVETKGLLEYQGRAGIISIVRWNLCWSYSVSSFCRFWN